MAGLDAQFGPVAERLLTKFGRSIALTRETDGVYDPLTRSSTKTASAVSGVGVMVPIKAREVNGTAIQVGDRRLIFRGDVLQIDDRFEGFRVAMLEDVDPDATGPIIQKAIMRR